MNMIVTFVFFKLQAQQVNTGLGMDAFPRLLNERCHSQKVRIFITTIVFLKVPLCTTIIVGNNTIFVRRVFRVSFGVSLLVFALMVTTCIVTKNVGKMVCASTLRTIVVFNYVLFLLFSLCQMLSVNFARTGRTLASVTPLIPRGFGTLKRRK